MSLCGMKDLESAGTVAVQSTENAAVANMVLTSFVISHLI